MTDNDSLILQTAIKAATSATTILTQHLGTSDVQHKDDASHNLVTAADLAAEAAVLDIIQSTFPDHDVMGEEGLSTGELSAEHLWVVDPLDGTTNFAQGIPHYCSAVSYVRAGQVQVGVIHDPNRDELFQAVRGKGAFLNGQPIHVSTSKTLSEAVIATGFYYDRGELMQRTLKSIESLFQHKIRGIRRLGSAALDQCWVACGRMEGFYEYQLAPWDYAAASLIVEEAGGRCADRAGETLRLDSLSLIATSETLFYDIVSIVKW